MLPSNSLRSIYYSPPPPHYLLTLRHFPSNPSNFSNDRSWAHKTDKAWSCALFSQQFLHQRAWIVRIDVICGRVSGGISRLGFILLRRTKPVSGTDGYLAQVSLAREECGGIKRSVSLLTKETDGYLAQVNLGRGERGGIKRSGSLLNKGDRWVSGTGSLGRGECGGIKRSGSLLTKGDRWVSSTAVSIPLSPVEGTRTGVAPTKLDDHEQPELVSFKQRQTS
ncbi:hypothetical protein J6590_087321 [Homalodisca vitripennis]|nr:hypothetical protein J6590_087321 [Homalodisca vitripennis]